MVYGDGQHTAKPPRRDGKLCSHPNNMSAVIRAFEDAGVMFLSATKVAARVAQRVKEAGG